MYSYSQLKWAKYTVLELRHWLSVIPARERRSHGLDHQAGGIEAQFVRVIMQIHNGDVHYLPFGHVRRKTKQGVTRVDHSSDVSGAEIVGRGHALLHQIGSGRHSGMSSYCH